MKNLIVGGILIVAVFMLWRNFKKISRVNATAQAVIRRIKTGVRKQLKKAKKKSSDLFQSFLVY